VFSIAIPSPESEERQQSHDHDDQADEINNSTHNEISLLVHDGKKTLNRRIGSDDVQFRSNRRRIMPVGLNCGAMEPSGRWRVTPPTDQTRTERIFIMRKLRSILAPALTVGLLAVPALALTACEDKGPAEKAGEAVDEAVKDTGRAIEDAAD
tara:strand:- start:2449 stop:2907 length:459 start_codon:yes stop_codon:yes gene_type:complete